MPFPAAAVVALLLLASVASAAPGRLDATCAPGRPPAWAPAGLWDDPSRGRGEKLGRTLLHQSDLANGALLYVPTLAGIGLGVDPPERARWTSSAGFEDDVREDVVAGSMSGRTHAGTWSDALLHLTWTAPLWLDAVGRSWLWNDDCTTAVAILGETVEAVSLTLLLTQATKVIAGRERPYQRECDANPRYDDDCFDDDSRASFWSGHAAWSAAGAGLLCRNTYRREKPVWGRLGSIRNPIPCALGVGAAIATGMLRIRADEHWMGDVITGWAVGFAIGLFDLPGPFDLLKFRHRTATGAIEGALLPTIGRGTIGARLTLRF